jgi:hypothetical protein
MASVRSCEENAAYRIAAQSYSHCGSPPLRVAGRAMRRIPKHRSYRRGDAVDHTGLVLAARFSAFLCHVTGSDCSLRAWSQTGTTPALMKARYRLALASAEAAAA